MLRPELAARAPTRLEHTLPLLEESPPYLRKPQDWLVPIIASITEQNRMTLALDVVDYAEGRRIAADTTVNQTRWPRATWARLSPMRTAAQIQTCRKAALDGARQILMKRFAEDMSLCSHCESRVITGKADGAKSSSTFQLC
jgi:hypothetical protein